MQKMVLKKEISSISVLNNNRVDIKFHIRVKNITAVLVYLNRFHKIKNLIDITTFENIYNLLKIRGRKNIITLYVLIIHNNLNNHISIALLNSYKQTKKIIYTKSSTFEKKSFNRNKIKLTSTCEKLIHSWKATCDNLIPSELKEKISC